MSERYDIIIIGTGAGGGTLLHELAPTAKKILVLERGGYLPQEADNWSSKAVFVDHKYKAKELWFDRDGNDFKPEIHYYVGGQTKLYGSALLRFRQEDFGELRHHEGMSPAWPVSYDEFEPYYARAENLYQVHGQRGLDPIEPPSSGPYPHPPVSHEPRIQQIHDDLVALGHRPYPLPVGIMLDEKSPDTSKCIRCITCDGYPCKIHAKSDTETICVKPALEHPNVTLLIHSRVVRLEADAAGRVVQKVIVERDGEVEEYLGDLVVLSAGAINSAAILLRSRGDAHPTGLANSSDLVGRNYMCHNNSAFVALTTEVNRTRFQKTLALNDFYFGADDWEFPLGHIQTMGKADAEKFEAAAPVPLPYFVRNQIGLHSVDFWMTSEDLPRRDNRISVDDAGNIRIHYVQNNLEGHNRLNTKLSRLLRRISKRIGPLPLVICLRKKIPIVGVTHQCGTLVFGKDPKESVLDPNCRAHDLDNLYVVDAGCFPSSAAMNPALTIFANAIRVADHLKERLR